MKLFLNKILFNAGIVVIYICIPEEKNPFNFDYRSVSTDLDGDGGLDACFKVCWPYHSNAYGGKPHINFMENLLISK